MEIVLVTILKHRSQIIWHLGMSVKFVKNGKKDDDADDGTIDTVGHFMSQVQITFVGDSVERIGNVISIPYNKLYQSCQEFQREGSGWTIDKIINMRLTIAKFNPLAAQAYVESPYYIKSVKSLLIVQNTNDNKFFLWSILVDIHRVSEKEHPCRVAKYTTYEDELDMTGIEYLVRIKDIPRFEKQNNWLFNVFGSEGEGEHYPLYISPDQKDGAHTNLLLYKVKNQGYDAASINNDKNNSDWHYYLIKYLNKFLYSTHKRKCKMFFCSYCFNGFTAQKILDKHKPYCQTHGMQ